MAGVRKAYLPGTEATVITKAVPPERGLVIALPTGLTSAIIPNVDNSCVKFLIAGNGVRAVPTQINKLSYYLSVRLYKNITKGPSRKS